MERHGTVRKNASSKWDIAELHSYDSRGRERRPTQSTDATHRKAGMIQLVVGSGVQ